ncbi:PREDICTED: protein BTG2-like [Vollenhovia emeryi]|uniref:protein BTG2-like n=1 Tax=Vollenhovia emeryi TaxID=411798 RepID=UPI0005F3DA9D|nr:PREDICTED: protein BTG2-like [Vollenhovia emeryi]
MRLEILSAADFLVHLLRLQAGQLSDRQLEMFKSSLTEVLRHRYRDHWFPDRPNRGSGYRCIRINGKMDPVIAQAGANVGLLPTVLHSLFPSELTMWIDPSEVSYRIGENGSICVLYERTEAESAEEISQQQHQHQHQHPHHHSQQHQQAPTMPPPPPPPLQQQQQQQQFESCKDSLLLEHTQFSEQIAAYVSS